MKVRENAIKMAKCLLRDDIEAIDSFYQNAPHDAKPLWILGESLKLLSTADIAFFAKGWEKLKRCKLERECAYVYGIKIIEENQVK